MNELVVKSHNFEVAKEKLKEFSQKESEELKIENVETDGWFFGFGDHKVNGYEFNSRLRTIQGHLIGLNDTNNETIKEFGRIYEALEALDEDYIKAILISIKATEKTSENIQVTQEKIKKIIEDQKRTLEILKKFKQKIDSYSHIEDIDKIWNECQEWYEKTNKLVNLINNTTSKSEDNARKIEKVDLTLENMQNKLNYNSSKLEALEKINHLNDIDEIWESNKIHYSHFENLKKQRNEMEKVIQENKESAKDSITTAIEKTDAEIQKISNKLKYAYLIGGGALILVIIELLIIFMKVM